MSLNVVTLGIEYFPDPNAGRPIYFGSIYIGEPDTDPEIEINQKEVILRQEDGSDVIAEQPLTTGAGGVVLYEGSAVRILTDGNYSIKVLNKNGTQVYYVESFLEDFFPDVPASNISYDPSNDTIIDADNVQDAIDELEDYVADLDNDLIVSVNPAKTPMLSDYELEAVEVFGIVQTGQSLAEGGVGYDYTPTFNAINNASKTLTSGPIGLDTGVLRDGLLVLNERQRATIGNTLMDGLISTGIGAEGVFHGQAWGGQNYDALKKGGTSGVYEKCIDQVDQVVEARANVIYKAVTIIHGEQDGLDNNTDYEADLGDWQADFNTDIKAAAGQSADVQVYLCQTATAGGYGFNGGITETTFPTPTEQLAAHVNNPDITMSTSKYAYDYFDGPHITNFAQAKLGEKYSQAIAYTASTGVKWQPVRPASISSSGNVVTVVFTGSELTPQTPLVFDTSIVTAITDNGFSYIDDSANAISSMAITAYDTIDIVLMGTVGANPILAYAYHNGAGGGTNQANGLGDRGNLRDSSRAVSKVDGSGLYNWCVIFRESF
jgi:hypothetical protein